MRRRHPAGGPTCGPCGPCGRLLEAARDDSDALRVDPEQLLAVDGALVEGEGHHAAVDDLALLGLVLDGPAEEGLEEALEVEGVAAGDDGGAGRVGLVEAPRREAGDAADGVAEEVLLAAVARRLEAGGLVERGELQRRPEGDGGDVLGRCEGHGVDVAADLLQVRPDVHLFAGLDAAPEADGHGLRRPHQVRARQHRLALLAGEDLEVLGGGVRGVALLLQRVLPLHQRPQLLRLGDALAAERGVEEDGPRREEAQHLADDGADEAGAHEEEALRHSALVEDLVPGRLAVANKNDRDLLGRVVQELVGIRGFFEPLRKTSLGRQEHVNPCPGIATNLVEDNSGRWTDSRKRGNHAKRNSDKHWHTEH
mmetsp:Transcript_15509/g.33099  ORF Transcript_15509/g.33099 Transcript_15509/m.33099 type:complete len:368 (-) Transcript_15509:12-1115(-)